jgi:hypothetical protein
MQDQRKDAEDFSMLDPQAHNLSECKTRLCTEVLAQ